MRTYDKRRLTHVAPVQCCTSSAIALSQTLQHLATRCTTLQHSHTCVQTIQIDDPKYTWDTYVCVYALPYVTVCCSVLQCVAVRCSALQGAAVRCTFLQRNKGSWPHAYMQVTDQMQRHSTWHTHMHIITCHKTWISSTDNAHVTHAIIKTHVTCRT